MQDLFPNMESFQISAPVKKVKKLYEDDTSVAIPERTKYRWKTKEQTDTEVNVIRVNQFDGMILILIFWHTI